MQKFGAVCYAYKHNKKKLDSRGEKGVFIGYDKNSPAYFVYYPNSERVLKQTAKICVEPISRATNPDRDELRPG